MLHSFMTPNHDTTSEDANREAVEGFSDWTEDDLFDADDEGDSGSATRGGSRGTFLTDLDETLRGAGLSVTEQDGWRQRSNQSGGYNGGPIGIIIHHTGGGRGADGQGDVNFILTKPDAAPVSNLYLDRKGVWWVLAAGATNTNGKGGPWGPIPIGGANRRVIGIEAGNLGNNKEPWPEVMQDSYVKGVATLADRYGIDSNNVLSHAEWTSRKHDPAGPSRFGTVNSLGTWDMNKFRAEVNEARRNRSSVKVRSASPEDSSDGKYVVEAGDAWWSIAEKTMGDARSTWESLAAANGGKDRVLLVGQMLTIPGKDGAGAGTTQAATTKASAGTSSSAFPGEAKRGMKGEVVVAWQEALIAHGVIADTKGNHDGDYGEGMEKAVLELQQSWDWSDADGIAGRGTWKKLQSVGG